MATSQLPNLRYNCDSHIFISFVSPKLTSFHSVFYSFHGLMNSINWPVSSVWVFIAQLVEHCRTNAEARIPLKPRKTFFEATSQLLKLRFSCDGHIFISFVFPQFTSFPFYVLFLSRVNMNSINWPALHVWVFKAQLVEYCSTNAEATGSNPLKTPKIFFGYIFIFLAFSQFTSLSFNI